MKLTEAQKRHLRTLAHKLKPVVIIGGSGLSEAVLRELDLSLAHHELLKVRVAAGERDERKSIIAALCEKTGAVLVQSIGHVAVIYRPRKQPVIQLPA